MVAFSISSRRYIISVALHVAWWQYWGKREYTCHEHMILAGAAMYSTDGSSVYYSFGSLFSGAEAEQAREDIRVPLEVANNS
jgi:hypothetical protein